MTPSEKNTQAASEKSHTVGTTIEEVRLLKLITVTVWKAMLKF